MELSPFTFDADNNQKFPIRVIRIPEKPWFRGKDIAEALGYLNSRDAISNHVEDDDKMRLEDVLKYEQPKKITRNLLNSIFINKNGLKSLLIKSRKKNAIALAKFFGIDVSMSKIPCKESQILSSLCRFLDNQKINYECQYKCGNYYCDLYIPNLNLVIEIDENEHTDRDEIKEKDRETYISEKIKCKFIRYNPDAKNSDIADIYSELFNYIKNMSHDQFQNVYQQDEREIENKILKKNLEIGELQKIELETLKNDNKGRIGDEIKDLKNMTEQLRREFSDFKKIVEETLKIE